MDFLDGINTISITFQSTGGVFKLLFFVVVVGYVIYSLLLTVRVRILNDTVKTGNGGKMLALSYLHLLVSVLGGLFCVILILMG